MDVSFVQMLIPLAVPIMIAGVKWALPKIPKHWVPVMAPLLGAGLDILSHFVATGAFGGGPVGAILGSAGVGVREAIDQWRKKPA